MEERLQKFLARNGVDSRRKCEQHILEGKVSVNGNVVNKLGEKINPEVDIVKFDGKIVQNNKDELVYILLNKPEGYITTVKDQFDRESVLDLVTDIKERVYPIGRLDYETSGLLLLTNDGDLTYKLTHPKHEVDKTYVARVKGKLTKEEIERFKTGLKIEDYTTAPAKLKVIKYDEQRDSSLLEIKIHEGKNRQVRKMCKAINHPVLRLKRTAMGKIRIGECEIGKYRYLTEDEVKYLKSI